MDRYRKTIAAVVGVVAQLVATGVLDDPELKWASALIAVATAAGVYSVPNDPNRLDDV